MKKVFILTAITVITVFAISCNGSSSKEHGNSNMKDSSTQVKYTCTMHPEVISDTPGTCPKCGMALVVKE